jgi:hypothetical protein
VKIQFAGETESITRHPRVSVVGAPTLTEVDAFEITRTSHLAVELTLHAKGEEGKHLSVALSRVDGLALAEELVRNCR